MSDSLAVLLVTLELIIFFAFDILFAQLLSRLKQDHPELDECAPEESPDLDPIAVVNSLRQTAMEVYDHQKERFGGRREEADINDVPFGVENSGAAPSLHERENMLHSVVVACGLLAPAFTVLQVVFPTSFMWCRFAAPVWMQYIGVIPGLAGTVVFVTRTMHVTSLVEVNKLQWIALMWFRLDFMFLMSAVAFFGLGGWLVAMCMTAVALYMAHRVMRIEKRLDYLTRETQLVRGEVDVLHVYPPGTKEAEQALASSDVQGYNALR